MINFLMSDGNEAGACKMAKYSLLSASPVQTGLRQLNFSKALCEAFLEENSFVKKYADKIAATKKNMGKGNHLVKEYTDKMTATKMEAFETELVLKGKAANRKLSSSCKNLKECNESVENSVAMMSHSCKKHLNSFMNLELLRNKSEKEITSIWNQYHISKHCIYAVIPKEAYYKMHLKAKEFPTFLYPVPKGEGYEFMLSHFIENSCYFTSLLNYQIHAERAPVSLTVTYYPDLCEEKGIALMRGDHDDALIKIHEAQFLANQLQLYYGKDDSKKKHLLSTFTMEPQNFNYVDLINELERGFS